MALTNSAILEKLYTIVRDKSHTWRQLLRSVDFLGTLLKFFLCSGSPNPTTVHWCYLLYNLTEEGRGGQGQKRMGKSEKGGRHINYRTSLPYFSYCFCSE